MLLHSPKQDKSDKMIQQAYLSEEARKIFKRYHTQYGLTEAEALEELQNPITREEFEELCVQLQTMPEGEEKKQLAAKASRGAYAFRINFAEQAYTRARALMDESQRTGMTGEESIDGVIAYFNMKDFWLSLSDDDRFNMERWNQSAMVLGGGKTSLTKGKVDRTSQSAANLLWGFASWAITEKKYQLAEKLLLYAEQDTSPSPIDLHFIYNQFIKANLKPKERPECVPAAKEYCLKDISLFPIYKKQFIERDGAVPPSCPAFQGLASIYEMECVWDDMVSVCEMAIREGLRNAETTGGFEGRIEKLKVFDIIKQHPGILQKEVCQYFQKSLQGVVRNFLHFLSEKGLIDRKKKGSTYELYLP